MPVFMMAAIVLVADTTPPSDVTGGFLQYGALGAIVIVALYAVLKLFSRLSDAMDKETARADRMEQELRDQSRVIQEKLVVELTKATEAIAEVTQILSRMRERS